jgi:demethylmenaquinone methyltransferase/2-methoxy-6-polyprenyl-1,4-benzoquinol methylase
LIGKFEYFFGFIISFEKKGIPSYWAFVSELSNAKEFGLGKDWVKVQEVLKEIIPVYDKTNRYISLGSDIKIRREGLDLLKKSLGSDLSRTSMIDLGAGTGRLTELFGHSTVMSDALLPMLKVASERNRDSESVVSVFENLPFKTGTFRAAMSAFSIRDAENLKSALDQITKVIKPGGFFLIIDLAKPDSRLRRILIGGYWRIVAPLIAFAVAGRMGLKFAALSTTFRRLPTTTAFITLASAAGLELVASKYFMFGGAGILLFRKVF